MTRSSMHQPSRLVPAVTAAFLAGALWSGSALADVVPPITDEAITVDPVVEASDDILRICSSRNNAPFSMGNETGFENRLAVILAEEMGREPVFVWSDRPAIYLVRDHLDNDDCDVVMGVDSDDERLLTSEPYYRTGYVFVSREETGFEGDSWDDAAIGGMTRFAVPFASPAEVMLRVLNKYEDNAAYQFSLVDFQSRRNVYTQVPSDRLVLEVAQGHADLAVAFAPEVARYVEASNVPLRMTVIADTQQRGDGVDVPHHYSQSVGVRLGEEELLGEIDEALISGRSEIRSLLEEEGIPLLDLPS